MLISDSIKNYNISLAKFIKEMKISDEDFFSTLSMVCNVTKFRFMSNNLTLYTNNDEFFGHFTMQHVKGILDPKIEEEYVNGNFQNVVDMFEYESIV